MGRAMHLIKSQLNVESAKQKLRRCRFTETSLSQITTILLSERNLKFLPLSLSRHSLHHVKPQIEINQQTVSGVIKLVNVFIWFIKLIIFHGIFVFIPIVVSCMVYYTHSRLMTSPDVQIFLTYMSVSDIMQRQFSCLHTSL